MHADDRTCKTPGCTFEYGIVGIQIGQALAVALRWLFYNWHVARYFLFLAPEPKAPEPQTTLRAYLFEIIESESEPRFQILVRTLCIPPLSLDLSLSYRGRCWLSADICITPPAKLSGHPYQGGASASLALWVSKF